MRTNSDRRRPAPLADHPDLALRATVGQREELAFVTAAGVASPDAFRPPELLLCDVLAEGSPATVLVPQAAYGVVGIALAGLDTDVRMTETSARAARLCRLNARRNGVADRTAVALAPDLRALPRRFEAAALAPRQYAPAAVVEQRLADALATLEPDGACYLAAAPDTGLARYRRPLGELCADVRAVAERDGWTVLRGTRPDGFEHRQYARHRTIRPTVDGTDLELVTSPGLFAATRLDDGTRALARNCGVVDGEAVLDLCCGYGPLGIYAGATADCAVTLTDDDVRATAGARASARRSGVDPRAIVTADCCRGVRDRRFDRILCNPPTHAGGAVLEQLLSGASDVLAPGGVLELVHHRGFDLDRYLEPHFGELSATQCGEYRLVTAHQ